MDSSRLTDLLFESAGVGLCLVAPDGSVVRANAEWLRSTGFAADDVLGASAVDLFPATRDMALAMHARARAGHHVEVPRHAERVNGRETWWEGSIDPVPMEGGTGLLITAREVTFPRPLERAGESSGGPARAERDRAVDVLEHGEAMYALDSEFRYVLVNRAQEHFTGKSRGETLGRRIWEVWPEATNRDLKTWDVLHRVMRERVPERFEEYFAPLDLWVDVLAFPTVDGGIAVFSRRINERKRIEHALRDSEQRFATMFHRSPLAMAWTRLPGGALADVNEEWVRLVGVPREEAIGKTADELGLVEAEDRRGFYEDILADGSAQREMRLVTRACGVRTVITSGEHVTLAGEQYLLGVLQDITDRKLAEDALREGDRRKDEFLAMLSHELRNPLAPIRNSIYILRHAEPRGDQARRAQDVIERQAEHLTRLVDDLLDVTRIARGKIELRRSRVDLREVVLRAADDFRLTLEDRGVGFRAVIPDAKVPADVDATRIVQVVGNLLHNAAKFTRRGDDVVLSLHVAGAQAEVRVRDSGAGIDPALLPLVFEPFVQGERTLARTEGGLGLGLALVKGVAELHGGTVRAESAGKGKGAEFVVRLPLVDGSAAEGATRAPVERGEGARRVLIVDDNVDAAHSLAEIVRMLGHAAEVAHDGLSAIEKARDNPPDIVLCDIGLPGMSGYEVAQALRRNGNAMQLFAVTGYAQPEDVKKAVDAGFDGHVAKPVDPEDIGRLLA